MTTRKYKISNKNKEEEEEDLNIKNNLINKEELIIFNDIIKIIYPEMYDNMMSNTIDTLSK